MIGYDAILSSRPHVFALLADPPVRRVVIGGAISAYGDALQNAAQAWLAVQLTHSAHAVGLFALAWLMPRALSSLVAGVCNDRYPRATVLKSGVGIGTAIAALFFVCSATGVLDFPVLLLLACAFALTYPFEVSARNALLPSFVPPDRIPAIVSLSFVVMYTAEFLGLVSGGLLLAGVGMIGCVALNLGTYFVYLALIWPLRPRVVPRPTMSFFASLAEGTRFALGSRHMVLPLGVGAAYALLGFHFDRSTLPLFAIEDLMTPARTYGVLLAASPMGAIVFLSLWRSGGPIEMPRRVFWSALALAIGLALLAFCDRASLAILIVLGIGAAKGIHYNALSTMLQTRVHDTMRGRLFSFYNIAGGLFGVGGLGFAWLATSVGASMNARVPGLAQLHDPHGLRGALMIAAIACGLSAFAILRPLRRLGAS